MALKRTFGGNTILAGESMWDVEKTTRQLGKWSYFWKILAPNENSHPVEKNPGDKIESGVEIVGLNSKSMQELAALEEKKHQRLLVDVSENYKSSSSL